MIKNLKTKSSVRLMEQQFMVRNRQTKFLKLIPYVGCKSGFAHIFDSLIPVNFGKKIYDVFGGGGGFTFYACSRFGSKNVVYNDHNPVIINLIETLKKNPDKLYEEYQKHYKKSNPDYYLRVRKMDLEDDVRGAGRFFYLAKNAFSGKIRFNSKNEFNCPMRKNTNCPQINIESIRLLSSTIKYLKITNKDFERYQDVRDGFVYLDPPYMNNLNGHYNATVMLETFVRFLEHIQESNKIMLSEQNDPDYLMLSSDYSVFKITLKRSLQYFTQHKSKEIVAINYNVPKVNLMNYV